MAITRARAERADDLRLAVTALIRIKGSGELLRWGNEWKCHACQKMYARRPQHRHCTNDACDSVIARAALDGMKVKVAA